MSTVQELRDEYGHLEGFPSKGSKSAMEEFVSSLGESEGDTVGAVVDVEPVSSENERLVVATPTGPSFDELVHTETPQHGDVDHSFVKPEIAEQHLTTPLPVVVVEEGAVSSEGGA